LEKSRKDNQVRADRRGMFNDTHGPRHEKWRLLVIARHPVCCICKERVSTVADHVIPLSEGGDWKIENGQGVCAVCHNRKTAAARSRGERGEFQ
jgi:5-methylcytosine-specific restriction endonuclease McrA